MSDFLIISISDLSVLGWLLGATPWWPIMTQIRGPFKYEYNFNLEFWDDRMTADPAALRLIDLRNDFSRLPFHVRCHSTKEKKSLAIWTGKLIN